MLIVEDDPATGEQLGTYFSEHNYEVVRATDGEKASRLLIGATPFDIVLLDLMLPRKSGFEVLREARQAGIDTPVIILSVSSSEEDKLKGFNLGADDYVTKPFSTKEIAARVRVILRRVHTAGEESVEQYTFDDMSINFSNHTAQRNGSKLQFTALEFSILHYFIRHRGRTVSRKQLLIDVWGIKGDITTRTIDRHVASLRKKIETDPTEPKYIQTVYGIGYKFTG
ncbi:MAG: response regulator transcription factor [Rhodothermales bacterium]